MTKQNENTLTVSRQEEEATTVPGRRQTGSLPVSYVPTPTREYRALRQSRRATLGAGLPLLPNPTPIPVAVVQGSRVLLWKQEPAACGIGIRKACLSTKVQGGPRDSRIAIIGLAPVYPNALGDFIQTPG